MNKWEKAWKKLWGDAQRRYGGKLAIRPKYDWWRFWTALTYLLKAVTCGKGINLREQFYTTMGFTIWTPGDGSDWEAMSDYHKYGLLSHEIDHIDAVWIGNHEAQDYPDKEYQVRSWLYRLSHSIRYMLWPLPFKYAYHRQKIEFWGYTRTLEANVMNHGQEVTGDVIEWIKGHFTGPSYAWMATDERAEVLMSQMIATVLTRLNNGKLDHLKD